MKLRILSFSGKARVDLGGFCTMFAHFVEVPLKFLFGAFRKIHNYCYIYISYIYIYMLGIDSLCAPKGVSHFSIDSDQSKIAK